MFTDRLQDAVGPDFAIRNRGLNAWGTVQQALLLEDLGMIQGQPGERAFARGVGWRLHRVLLRTVYQPWRSEEFLGRTPDALRAAVREGYEEAVLSGRLKVEP